MTSPREEPVTAAAAVARQLLPRARMVVVGGSVLTVHRTPLSDLDMVAVFPRVAAPHHRTLRWEGWPVELLVHDEETLAAHCADGFRRRWPGIPRLLARGVLLVDEDGLGARLRAEMRQRLADGPAPATAAETDAFRHELTELLDDLAGTHDAGEAVFVAARLLTKTAQLALLTARHWQGNGKWLLRELRTARPELAAALTAAAGDPATLAAVARTALDEAGGPLREYRVAQPRQP
ncbi:nucleotidyltransferase domain-containing protein [Streptomyces catenulae]|uniref:Nucleotidyltransferase domain-containing protein n=1 Tax=Streptomyces catenulae TaxID=66875 RepID=A0ABV2Z2C2_9ACTN|nr:nucleotidyltransferase domain-containing protein [Streptomyces catenulae]